MPSVSSRTKTSRHLGERVAELAAELEVRRGPHVLLVESGRADDVDAGSLRHLGHELDVATEIDRARVDQRAHAELVQLGKPLDAACDVLAACGAVGWCLGLPSLASPPGDAREPG